MKSFRSHIAMKLWECTSGGCIGQFLRVFYLFIIIFQEISYISILLICKMLKAIEHCKEIIVTDDSDKEGIHVENMIISPQPINERQSPCA
jgi:hypothetical protein